MFLYSITQSLIYDFDFGFDFEFDFVFYFGFDFRLVSLLASVQPNARTLAHLSLHPGIDAATLPHLTLHASSIARHYEGLRPNNFS